MSWIIRFFAILTLFALAVSSVIPQGWMPTQGSNGQVLLVLCTSDGVVEQWVDLDEDDDPLHDETDERVMCPFAGLKADIDLFGSGATHTSDLSGHLEWPYQDYTHHSAGNLARYDARAPPSTS